MKPTTTQTEKVIICEHCRGTGKQQRQPQHFADDTYKLIDCYICKGSGRLQVLITTITRPYVKA